MRDSRNAVRLFYIYLLLFNIYLTYQQTLEYQWISAFMGVQMSVYGCTNFKKYLIKIFVV